MTTTQSQETPEQHVAMLIIAAWQRALPELRRTASDEISNFVHALDGFNPVLVLSVLDKIFVVSPHHH